MRPRTARACIRGNLIEWATLLSGTFYLLGSGCFLFAVALDQLNGQSITARAFFIELGSAVKSALTGLALIALHKLLVRQKALEDLLQARNAQLPPTAGATATNATEKGAKL